MEPLRVYVVDDHPMIRHGLAAMLADDGGMAFVGASGSGEQALAEAPAQRPDVMLVDLVMPGLDGVATMAALRKLLPQTRFVVLHNPADAAALRRAMAAGAAGAVLKSASAQELMAVIHAARKNPAPVADEAGSAPGTAERPGPAANELTPRERELLALMARGLTNQDIAAKLGIAMPTVKFHVTNVLAKLHADNRTEAVLAGLRQGLVRLD